MKRFYAEDTDTLMFVFRDVEIGEELDHVDLDEDTSLELDCNGYPVGLTIESAKQRVSEQVSRGAAWGRELPTVRRLHFEDTDTLLFEFGDSYVDGPIDHVDLDYQTSLEFDCEGNLFALTIEFARERGVLPELTTGHAAEQTPA